MTPHFHQPLLHCLGRVHSMGLWTHSTFLSDEFGSCNFSFPFFEITPVFFSLFHYSNFFLFLTGDSQPELEDWLAPFDFFLKLLWPSVPPSPYSSWSPHSQTHPFQLIQGLGWERGRNQKTDSSQQSCHGRKALSSLKTRPVQGQDTEQSLNGGCPAPPSQWWDTEGHGRR